MINKFYFPLHFDGGNRGCEGIAKGTALLLDRPSSDLIGYCRDVQLDTFLGIDKYISLQPTKRETFFDKLERKAEQYLLRPNKTELHFKYQYRYFLNQITKEDCMLSTGGDMLCYGNNMVNTTNNILSKRGIKTILWGCSMGRNNYTKEKGDTLKRFDLIYARESLTYEYFKSLNLNNVCCYPDPAFILEPEIVEIPESFKRSEVIGINISPFVMGGYDLSSPFAVEVKKLIEYLLQNTNLNILLIPHVLWKQQDDRVVSNRIEQLYNNRRITVLKSESYNYLQIRYIISKCKYFNGGRTHSVISAYSTCVPSIAIGYSIKALGIAKDLGLSKSLVVDSKKCNNNSLLESYLFLVDNENKIKNHLINFIPSYKKTVYGIRQNLNSL